MRHSNEFGRNYIRFSKSVSSNTENLIKEQLLKEDPKLANNPSELRKEVSKRAYNIMMFIDSSYYLG